MGGGNVQQCSPQANLGETEKYMTRQIKIKI
jgi:hypothetical protein